MGTPVIRNEEAEMDDKWGGWREPAACSWSWWDRQSVLGFIRTTSMTSGSCGVNAYYFVDISALPVDAHSRQLRRRRRLAGTRRADVGAGHRVIA